MNTCVICKKEFEPKPHLRKRQKCCSPECSYVRNLQINNMWRAAHRDKVRESARRQPKKRRLRECRCKLCGGILIKPETRERISSIHMHDECVYNDIISTLNDGEKLSAKQKLRLYSRGWTVTEFKDEVWKGRLDEVES